MNSVSSRPFNPFNNRISSPSEIQVDLLKRMLTNLLPKLSPKTSFEEIEETINCIFDSKTDPVSLEKKNKAFDFTIKHLENAIALYKAGDEEQTDANREKINNISPYHEPIITEIKGKLKQLKDNYSAQR